MTKRSLSAISPSTREDVKADDEPFLWHDLLQELRGLTRTEHMTPLDRAMLAMTCTEEAAKATLLRATKKSGTGSKNHVVEFAAFYGHAELMRWLIYTVYPQFDDIYSQFDDIYSQLDDVPSQPDKARSKFMETFTNTDHVAPLSRQAILGNQSPDFLLEHCAQYEQIFSKLKYIVALSAQAENFAVLVWAKQLMLNYDTVDKNLHCKFLVYTIRGVINAHAPGKALKELAHTAIEILARDTSFKIKHSTKLVKILISSNNANMSSDILQLHTRVLANNPPTTSAERMMYFDATAGLFHGYHARKVKSTLDLFKNLVNIIQPLVRHTDFASTAGSLLTCSVVCFNETNVFQEIRWLIEEKGLDITPLLVHQVCSAEQIELLEWLCTHHRASIPREFVNYAVVEHEKYLYSVPILTILHRIGIPMHVKLLNIASEYDSPQHLEFLFELGIYFPNHLYGQSPNCRKWLYENHARFNLLVDGCKLDEDS